LHEKKLHFAEEPIDEKGWEAFLNLSPRFGTVAVNEYGAWTRSLPSLIFTRNNWRSYLAEMRGPGRIADEDSSFASPTGRAGGEPWLPNTDPVVVADPDGHERWFPDQ